MAKRKQTRQVGMGQPLSLRFLPKMKRRLDAIAKKEKLSFSGLATPVCRGYLDRQLTPPARPGRLPEEGRVGTSVKLDSEVERRLVEDVRVVEWEWEVAYLVRRLLEWHACGLLIPAVAPSTTKSAVRNS